MGDDGGAVQQDPLDAEDRRADGQAERVGGRRLGTDPIESQHARAQAVVRSSWADIGVRDVTRHLDPRSGDERAGAASHDQHAVLGEHADRGANRRPGDAEARRDLALRRHR
jgi:hypothetical protein